MSAMRRKADENQCLLGLLLIANNGHFDDNVRPLSYLQMTCSKM